MSGIVKCACRSVGCEKEVAVYDSMLEIRGDKDRADHSVYLDPNSIVALMKVLRAQLELLSNA